MSSINNRVVARGACLSSLAKAKVGGRSGGGGGGRSVTRSARYLFWNPFIGGEGGGGGADGVGVVRGWLLTLLTTGLGMGLVFRREVVISANVTTH